jgi:hypothetical protein
MWSQRKRLALPTEEDAGARGEKAGVAGDEADEKSGASEEGSVKSAYAITAQTTDLDGNLVGK